MIRSDTVVGCLFGKHNNLELPYFLGDVCEGLY